MFVPKGVWHCCCRHVSLTRIITHTHTQTHDLLSPVFGQGCTQIFTAVALRAFWEKLSTRCQILPTPTDFSGAWQSQSSSLFTWHGKSFQEGPVLSSVECTWQSMSFTSIFAKNVWYHELWYHILLYLDVLRKYSSKYTNAWSGRTDFTSVILELQ